MCASRLSNEGHSTNLVHGLSNLFGGREQGCCRRYASQSTLNCAFLCLCNCCHSVVDNVLLVTLLDSAVVMLLDVAADVISSVSDPLPLAMLPPVGSSGGAPFGMAPRVQSSSTLSMSSWSFELPGMVVDVAHQVRRGPCVCAGGGAVLKTLWTHRHLQVGTVMSGCKKPGVWWPGMYFECHRPSFTISL